MHLDLEKSPLSRGNHPADSGEACVMEMVSCLAGESWSDSPQCVSPIIAAFMRNWNDNMSDDDRQKLRVLIPVVMGTRTCEADELTRSWMAMDWLVREHCTAWLDLAGLNTYAAGLRGCAPITDAVFLAAAMPSLIEGQKKADAAWAAAWAAARAAAGAKLRPTVESLQASAMELVKRMADVGRK